jgi:hypothetical protein
MKKEDAQMIDGATRLFGIVGDPIAHVKAPTTLTRLFAARGINAVMRLPGGMMGSAGQTAVRWGTTSGAPSAPFTRSG